jgi:hypothetical protein
MNKQHAIKAYRRDLYASVICNQIRLG